MADGKRVRDGKGITDIIQHRYGAGDLGLEKDSHKAGNNAA